LEFVSQKGGLRAANSETPIWFNSPSGSTQIGMTPPPKVSG
jgi:hypothetical protein